MPNELHLNPRPSNPKPFPVLLFPLLVLNRFPFPSTTRKSHQRALESLQASLDVEVKGRTEGLRLKKKQEAELNELELQADLLTKTNAELSKNAKKMQQQIKVRGPPRSLPLFLLQSPTSLRRILQL